MNLKKKPTKANKLLDVALLSVSAGNGHIRASQALSASFKQLAPDYATEHIDVLDHTTKLFQKAYRDAYLELVTHAPYILGWLYDVLDKPHKKDRLRMKVELFHAQKFVRYIKEIQPRIAICTHFLPASLLWMEKLRGNIDIPIYTVITDFDVHGMWLATESDKYFVARNQSKVLLEKMGIPAERVHVSGIPTDPIFGIEKSREAMAKKHRLNPVLPTLLISAGGYGAGKVRELLEPLSQVTKPAQFVFLCGKNEKLVSTLSEEVKKLRNNKHQFKVLGFSTEMDELMSASDIMVGKPGGLTTSESLRKKLAWVVVNPIPGQEEHNTDYLLEEGVGVRCRALPLLGYQIDQILNTPGKCNRSRPSCERSG